MLSRIKRIHAALFSSPTGLARAAGSATPAPMETLEPRQLLAVNVLNPIPDGILSQNASPSVINLAGRYDNPELDGTIARFDTSLGAFNVVLYNGATPATVANFLRYLTEGRYNDNIFHRSVTNFVIQGGGFQRPSQDNANPSPVATFSPVQNEPGFSNIRGTIAMAKQGGNPNSATSQWFFNLGDNSGNLNNQNGGFTVFGRVIGNGMTVVDAIAAVPKFDANTFYGTTGLFTELPLRDFTGTPVKPDNFVSMNISTVPELTYTVTSSNAELVTPSLDGANLTLTYAANMTGSSTVTVRTTAADGSFVDDTFLVSVAGPAAIGLLEASPKPTVTAGQDLTLTAKNITDLTGSLAKVQFFHDSNGDGAWDAEDRLLGEDASSSKGWSLKFSTAGMPEGENRFFARAVTSSGAAGPVATVVQGIVPPPSVGSLTSSATPIDRGSKFELRAGDIVLPGAALKSVEFYRDTNGNGVFDLGIDKKIASASKLSGGFAIGKVSSKGFAMGENVFFARAQDKSKAWGEVIAATIEVANAAPTVKALKAGPKVVKNVGDRITLSVSGTKDTDGKVVRVQYFRDSEIEGEDGLTAPNGEFDENDLILGEVTSPSGGFKLLYTTLGLPLSANGADRFFARVFDNDGASSIIAMADVPINRPPSITGFEITPDTGDLLTSFTMSAGIGDPDGRMKSVEFFRDTNGNGVFDARGDKTLGKAKLVGDVWVLSVPGKKLFAGENRIFLRGIDNLGGFSQTPSLVVTLT